MRFIAAKVKVTPTKATSVPRLELVTAVLDLRLARTELLEISIENNTLYTFYDVPNKLPPLGLSDHDTVALQPLARQNLPKNKILLKSRDLRATNRMTMRTYLEEVNLGLLVGLKESCEEKTRTLKTIIKTAWIPYFAPNSGRSLRMNHHGSTNNLNSLTHDRQTGFARGEEESFRRPRNRVNRLRKSCRPKYCESKVEHLRDCAPRRW